MNIDFNHGRIIQTHYKQVPAHPINGKAHWEVYGRNVPNSTGDVLLGSHEDLGTALGLASKWIKDNLGKKYTL